MAERRPIVLLDNNVQSELPAGDTLPGTGCEGVNPTWRDRWTFVHPALSLYAQPYTNETLSYYVGTTGAQSSGLFGGKDNALLTYPPNSANGYTMLVNTSGAVISIPSVPGEVKSAATDGNGRWALVTSPGYTDPAIFLSVSSNDGVSFSSAGGTTSSTTEWRVVRTQVGFLAVRQDGTQSRRSLDASPTWSTSGLTNPGIPVQSLAAVGDTVVVASGNTFKVSTNAGATWSASYTVAAGANRRVVSSNGLFFLVPMTAGLNVFTSADGVTWTERIALSPTTGNPYPQAGVLYVDSMWVIPFGNYALVSTDSVVWNQITMSSNSVTSLSYAGNRMLYLQHTSSPMRSTVNKLTFNFSSKELGYDLPV